MHVHDGPLEPRRRHLGHEQRDADAQRHGEDQGHDRRDERAEDEGEHAELALARRPPSGEQEARWRRRGRSATPLCVVDHAISTRMASTDRPAASSAMTAKMRSPAGLLPESWGADTDGGVATAVMCLPCTNDRVVSCCHPAAGVRLRPRYPICDLVELRYGHVLQRLGQGRVVEVGQQVLAVAQEVGQDRPSRDAPFPASVWFWYMITHDWSVIGIGARSGASCTAWNVQVGLTVDPLAGGRRRLRRRLDEVAGRFFTEANLSPAATASEKST